MKQKNHILLLALGIGLSIFSACKSTKQTQTVKQTENNSMCDQTIKYYSEKAKFAGGQETNFNTEITINPSNRMISLVSEPPNQQKVTFSIVIESIDCNFNAEHMNGQALYNGYINQKDGTTTKMILRLEANNGILTFSRANPDKEDDMVVIVSKWEFVK